MAWARHLRAGLIAACFGVSASVAFCDELPGQGAGAGGTGAANSIEMFSQASQALYGKLSASLVRVRVDPTYMTVLTPPQRKDFLEWMRQQNADAATGAGTEQENSLPTPKQQRDPSAQCGASSR